MSLGLYLKSRGSEGCIGLREEDAAGHDEPHHWTLCTADPFIT